MIITCTECKKKFEVPDNAIPAEGRVVQCSSCSNEWKQFPIKKPEIVKKNNSFFSKKNHSTYKEKNSKKKQGSCSLLKRIYAAKMGRYSTNLCCRKRFIKKNKENSSDQKTTKTKIYSNNGKTRVWFF